MINFKKVLTSNLRNIRNIKRYSSSSVHHSENVAEHSYWVSYYSLLIAEDLLSKGVTLDFRLLLSKAILHDLPEGLTGDIIHTFKHHNAEMKAITNKTEEILYKETLEKEFPKQIATDLFELTLSSKEGFEGEIIALSDVICVFAYAYDEFQMGNKTILKTIKETKKKLEKTTFSKELMPYKKQILAFITQLKE